ncbi:Asp23/Gls24 family envelope stress response protein [Planotetraspora sp. GP83]|uniref:Asp23/Gls24 family envelope stress response protein n=1 Tax=Planotetraspora sp. GP83 TaxID=3156264 RepID=UPI003514F5FB
MTDVVAVESIHPSEDHDPVDPVDPVEEPAGHQVEQRDEGELGRQRDEPAEEPVGRLFGETDTPRQSPYGTQEPVARIQPAADPLTTAVVKGRIKVADEVVEKVAALAALEIPGVADLGGDLERAFENVRDRIGLGTKRANQGVRAQIQDRQVAVDVTIVIEYGHVVMEVANEVKTNVARSVSHMLGMRVVEVNVTVDDVRLPGEVPASPREDDF